MTLCTQVRSRRLLAFFKSSGRGQGDYLVTTPPPPQPRDGRRTGTGMWQSNRVAYFANVQ